jgi:hypothetical protein
MLNDDADDDYYYDDGTTWRLPGVSLQLIG